MKKIALLLAMVMLLVCVLASCGGKTEESKDTSKEVSTEASKAPEESKASEESKTAEESKEPEESEEPEESIEPAAVGELISVGKPYTKSQLYRQGGADVNWAWDDAADPAYPDEDDKSLTDGVIDPEGNQYTDPVWAGFSASCPDYQENGYSWIIVDLEEKTDISQIVLSIGTSAIGSGIGADGFTAMFFVSDDGEEWTSLGSLAAVDDTENPRTDITFATNTSGQYVKVQMMRGGWMFVSEISVYDVAAE